MDEQIEWIWKSYLPTKLNLLAGAPATGKSTLAFNFAAIVSNGGTWPDGIVAQEAKVLIWSGEGGVTDTILPRLRAANANLKNIRYVESTKLEDRTSRTFDPAIDLPDLELLIQECIDDEGPVIKLVIIDPLISAVAGNSDKAAEVRRALKPLVELAGDYGIAVLGIHHFAKNSDRRKSTDRVRGSQAFGALARTVLVTAQAKDGDESVMMRSKANFVKGVGGLHYRIAPVSYRTPASYRHPEGELIETSVLGSQKQFSNAILISQ